MRLNDLAELLYQGWSDYVRPETQSPVAWYDLSKEQRAAWFEVATLVSYKLESERA